MHAQTEILEGILPLDSLLPSACHWLMAAISREFLFKSVLNYTTKYSNSIYCYTMYRFRYACTTMYMRASQMYVWCQIWHTCITAGDHPFGYDHHSFTWHTCMHVLTKDRAWIACTVMSCHWLTVSCVSCMGPIVTPPLVERAMSNALDYSQNQCNLLTFGVRRHDMHAGRID